MKTALYIYGRVKDRIVLPSGREIYLFDLANKIKEKAYIDDAILLQIPVEDDSVNLAAHIVWDKVVDKKDIIHYLSELDEDIKGLAPEINRCIYTFYEIMLPYSPTTLKKDKNTMAKQMEGYVEVVDGKLVDVRFRSIGDGKFRIETA